MEAGTSIAAGSTSRVIGRTKYGKSCLNCSKAKCKCNFLPGRPTCERCDRLNKQCKPLVPARRGEAQDVEPIKQSGGGDDLINGKLEELISLLKIRKGNVPSGVGTEVQGSENDELSDIPDASLSLPVHLRLDPTALTALVDDGTAATTFSEVTKSSSDDQVKRVGIPKLSLSPEQAQRSFYRFRTVMLPWLPFIYIPDSMTLAEFERMYPILHLCVSVTAATSTSQLYTWSEQFRQTIVKKMYDTGERSLDLLYAILTFVGWVRHHRQERPFFNLWLNMAITLVSDLGLDKRAQGDNTWWPWHRESVASEQSIVEKRLVLAVFVLSSISASAIKSINSLQWTAYMDTCLQELENSPEWYGDSVLVIQVRCCLLTETLNRLAQPISTVSTRFMPGSLSTSAVGQQKPTYIAALELQLVEIKDKIQAYGLEHNTVIALSVIVTELDVHEYAANPETPSDNHGLSLSENLSRYSSQLRCLKDWWVLFLSITPDQFPDIAFTILTQLIHCIVSLFRLTILDHPDWDRVSARSTADITEYLKMFAVTIEDSHHQVGLLCDQFDDILKKTATTMKKLRQFFLNLMIEKDLTTATAEDLAFDFNEPIPDMMDLDFWSSQWLADMMVPWEK